MAGLKIKSAFSPLALVDRQGGPQLSGNDIAPSLGHSNQASGEVRLSHFFAGYGSLTLGTTGFGDGYKLWQDPGAGGERGNVPNLQHRSPAQIEADGEDVPEIKFSDFYNVRQQDTSKGVSTFTAGTATATDPTTGFFGFATEDGAYKDGETFGGISGDVSSYNFNYRDTVCGINGATTAGWKIVGVYAAQTPYSNLQRAYHQYLHMQWDPGTGNSVPTRSNSGWTNADIGTWNGSSISEPSGLPTLSRSSQMTRTACTFVANQSSNQSYWRQSYGTGSPFEETGGYTQTMYEYHDNTISDQWTVILT